MRRHNIIVLNKFNFIYLHDKKKIVHGYVQWLILLNIVYLHACKHKLVLIYDFIGSLG